MTTEENLQQNKPRTHLSSNNISFRMERLEKITDKLSNSATDLTERVHTREMTISPEGVKQAQADIAAHTNKLQDLTKQLASHCHDNLQEIERLERRAENLQLKLNEYYTVVSPARLQETIESLHHTQLEFSDLRKRFDDFQQDRIKRMDDLSARVDDVRETAKLIESRVMERVDKNQIRAQQYVIGIAVGFIMTVLTSAVLLYFRI
jgi:tetrahydromethanopterin S-methyltransferase subunit G